MPATHSTQAAELDAPVAELYVPGPHSTHTEAPAAVAYVPAGEGRVSSHIEAGGRHRGNRDHLIKYKDFE